MRIVILGSCRFSPYEILIAPNPIPGLHNTDEGYLKAAEKFYPAMDECDEVWVYAPDGVGEHTGRDVDYARRRGKTIRILVPFETLQTGLWKRRMNRIRGGLI